MHRLDVLLKMVFTFRFVLAEGTHETFDSATIEFDVRPQRLLVFVRFAASGALVALNRNYDGAFLRLETPKKKTHKKQQFSTYKQSKKKHFSTFFKTLYDGTFRVVLTRVYAEILDYKLGSEIGAPRCTLDVNDGEDGVCFCSFWCSLYSDISNEEL